MCSRSNNELQLLYQELTQSFSAYGGFLSPSQAPKRVEPLEKSSFDDTSNEGASYVHQQPIGSSCDRAGTKRELARQLSSKQNFQKHIGTAGGGCENEKTCGATTARTRDSSNGYFQRLPKSTFVNERLRSILHRHNKRWDCIDAENMSGGACGFNDDGKQLTTMDWSSHGSNIVEDMDEPIPASSSSAYPFACWLCGTPCAMRPGWVDGPIFFDGKRSSSQFSLAALCKEDVATSPFISLLTLCGRCSMACSLPSLVAYEIVLQRAAATHVSAKRTPAFVSFLRGYKAFLESVSSSTRYNVDGHKYFNECPTATQLNILQQLIGLLESYVIGVKRTIFSEGSQSEEQLSTLHPEERHILEGELGLLQRHVQLIKTKSLIRDKHLRSYQMDSNSVADDSQFVRPTSFAPDISTVGAGWECATSSSVSIKQCEHGPRIPNEVSNTRVTLTIPTLQHHSPETEKVEQQQLGDVSVQKESRGSRILNQFIERAVAARAKRIYGHETILAATCSANNGILSTKDNAEPQGICDGAATPKEMDKVSALLCGEKKTEDILMQYFEGKIDKAPRLTLFPQMHEGSRKTNTVGTGAASECQKSSVPEKQHCNEVTREVAVAATTELPCAFNSLSGDAVDYFGMSREILIEMLRGETQQRLKVEKELRESYWKIATLEKATNHMSETILSHRIGSAVDHHLLSMIRYHRHIVQGCAEFTMQKSLLFADEMAILIRQAQNWLYSRPLQLHSQYLDSSSGTCVSDSEDKVVPDTEEEGVEEGSDTEEGCVAESEVSTVHSSRVDDGPVGLSGWGSLRTAPPTFPVSLRLRPLCSYKTNSNSQAYQMETNIQNI